MLSSNIRCLAFVVYTPSKLFYYNLTNSENTFQIHSSYILVIAVYNSSTATHLLDSADGPYVVEVVEYLQR